MLSKSCALKWTEIHVIQPLIVNITIASVRGLNKHISLSIVQVWHIAMWTKCQVMYPQEASTKSTKAVSIPPVKRTLGVGSPPIS